MNRTKQTNHVHFLSSTNGGKCFGVKLTLSDLGGRSSANIFVKPVDNSGFSAEMADNEIQAYWTAVGV